MRPWLLRLFCIGNVEPSVLQQLQAEIRELPSALLRERISVLAQLPTPIQRCTLPALHLWPTRDRLVTHSAARGIARGCEDLDQVRIDGPHFLLQSRPQACAQAILGFMAQLRA